MIKVNNVDKSFQHIKALSSLSMNVKKGSIYGLVGTNGSGKTTLLKHIAGIFMPDSGEIYVDGIPAGDSQHLGERVFFFPDELYFFGNYSLSEMERLYRRLYRSWNRDRFDRLTEMLSLSRGVKISRFSKGVQKQAMFALGMSTMPDVLLLDEPVDGLDPIVRRIVWDFIVSDVAEREMTVLISSHNLREIEGICDTVGILSGGTMVLERDLDDLRSSVHKVQTAFRERPDNPYKGLNVLSSSASGSVDMMIIKNTAEEIEEALAPHSPLILDLLPLTLEEVFIYELGGENNEYKDILE